MVTQSFTQVVVSIKEIANVWSFSEDKEYLHFNAQIF